MPPLWTATIESHREAVREATLAATEQLIAQHGVAAISMSQIAAVAGIGRATLYKYFADLDDVLRAWHERKVTAHVEALAAVRDRSDPPQRLRVMLEAYASMRAHDHGSELAAALDRGDHVDRAHDQVTALFREALAEAAEAGMIRGDISADELATYCTHALAGGAALRSKAALRRLVDVTLDGLRPR